MPRMNYTKLSLPEVTDALRDVAKDAQATFGELDVRQLNWRPSEAQWSVAQCFEHLLTSNGLMRQCAESALTTPPRGMQRLPLVPALCGWALIRSQAPSTKQKFTAPTQARPTISEIPASIIPRFVDQHDELAAWARAVDQREAERAIMASPFIRMVAYSVLDGFRLMVAHDRRHFEQARRVIESRGFNVTVGSWPKA